MERDELEKKKEVVLGFILSEQYKPMKLKEMAGFLQVPKQERGELKEVLDSLSREGKITADENGKYRKPDKNLLIGTFQATQKGFGFVSIEGEDEDIFIPESGVRGAMHLDTVQIKISGIQKGRRKEGEIIKILERGLKEIVGTFQKSRNFGFVIPDNLKLGKDIFISKKDTKDAVDGHKVVVEITDYGNKEKKPEGRVIEIIGHINDPGVDIMSIIKAYNIPTDFPKGVRHQLSSIPGEVSSADMAGRLDLREFQTVTIDGEDAKDLDDAITIEKTENDHYRLGVHIADVTNYVKEGTPLDAEAWKRGTSVYLVDRVVPMLPHQLSNGICSLNQGENRLALSCIMEIDEKGNVKDHRIAETVLKVDRRMTYTDVNKILEDRDEEKREEYKEFVPMFEMMQELAEILRKKRKKRGAIDFDFSESKILLNEEGHPVKIGPYERNKATMIIEDFMLLANETIAEDYFWQEIPFLYRTHDYPDAEKIQKLGIFINNFGYSIKISQDDIHPKELQKLLMKIEGTPEEAIISRLTLRSMKQAKYTVENNGHFGLSTKYYCHFTSPIRRYPDLQIHRIIKENLKKGMNGDRIKHYEKILPETAANSSGMERRAEEAEREVEKMKKVEYMQQFIGEEFDGVISGVTAWGLYVELENTVEGMVHITSLKDDFYIYDEEQYLLIGEHTKKMFKLGQKVRVVMAAADRLLRTIEFELVEEID